MDLDQVQAGEYELVALQWDQPTSKPGQPFTYVRHRQGALVTLDVEEARRLFAGGAVVKKGERQRIAAEAARAVYEAALAQLPDDIREQVQAGTPPPAPGAAPSTPPGDDQPAAERAPTGPTRGARR